jgi:hypothetical protein
VEQLLWAEELTSTPAADLLAVAMTEQTRPWFTGSAFRGSGQPTMPEVEHDLSALMLMLSLPLHESDDARLHWLPPDIRLPGPVRAFVESWMAGEISVIDRYR